MSAGHCFSGRCKHGDQGACWCGCVGCEIERKNHFEALLRRPQRLPTSREEAFLAAVLAGLPKARAKHPDGQRFIGVAAEFGEVAKAIDKQEGQERLYEECVDLALCALRLAIEGNGTR